MRASVRIGWVCATLAAIVFPCGSVAATAGKAGKEPQAKPLDFKKSERVKNGSFAYVVGKTTGDAKRYVATNLIVTQPVIVTLKAVNPKDRIKLVVTKTQWTKAEREGVTGADGRVQVAFRTQGDFGVAVSSASAGKPYRMSVWIGDEVKRPMPPVVVPKATWKAAASTKATPAEGAADDRAKNRKP